MTVQLRGDRREAPHFVDRLVNQGHSVSQLALAQLYRYAQPLPARDRKVVVACVEGELHDFPARLVADVLDLAGYDTRFLGADVPTGSLIDGGRIAVGGLACAQLQQITAETRPASMKRAWAQESSDFSLACDAEGRITWADEAARVRAGASEGMLLFDLGPDGMKERQRLEADTEVILSRQSLSRETAINRIRDALRKAALK